MCQSPPASVKKRTMKAPRALKQAADCEAAIEVALYAPGQHTSARQIRPVSARASTGRFIRTAGS